MRRDCVTQVNDRWSDGEEDNFATPFEAENYINYMLDELGEPIAAWLEDMWLYRGFDGKARLTMPRFFMSWSLGWVMGSEGLSRRA